MRPDYLNDDESENPTPGFSNVNKKNPFIVPENYFDSLADNIQAKINALPDVEKMSRENLFRVPEGHFDSLPSSVQQRIMDGKKKNMLEEWISIALRPKYSVSFAILVIVAIFGIKYFLKPTTSEKPGSSLSYNEVMNSEYIAQLDEASLIDMLEQEDKDNGVKEDNSLEQYLMDNDLDISQIEDHL